MFTQNMPLEFCYTIYIKLCQKQLESNLDTSQKIRQEFRENEFQNWSNQKWQGIGVCNFAEFPKINSFVSKKNGLSTSEWTAAVKLNTNYANLRGVPGVSSESTLCHRCGKENETSSHVISNCPQNGSLINSLHIIHHHTHGN